ncbi:hypothetical protein ACFODZ_08580 [Marinicella sediminis]|uniref:NAD synthetase n=1 Tax=Marinicella sediminis TaxID=1792834 RepID=A0ABV7JFW9_9GAMM|nr:hypothetical protein [Marinicella sediminis]
MHINSKSKLVTASLNQASKAIKQSVDSIPDLSAEQKKAVQKAIDDTTVVTAEVPNTFVYKLAIGSIAAVAVMTVLGGIYLAEQTPNFLQTTLATAIGALAGMVVPTPKAGL